MASTPTTKSQVQAYRFVLRRMESALVRRDSVLQHDPMGAHRRATGVGVALACVALVGFLVWGLFGGKGSVPGPGSIVIGKDTGSVYVVTSDPQAQKRLIPMLNMASAKLLAMSRGGQQGVPQPTTVKEAALAELPRGPRTGMVNAPSYMPEASNAALPSWSICDTGPKSDSSGKQHPGQVRTTVLGGVPGPGEGLRPDQSLYVQDQTTHQPYLVYVPHSRGNDHVVKAPVDPSQRAVMDVYGLNQAVPRTVSTNMLNSIPQAPALQVPQQVNQGGQASYMGGGRFQAGQVVQSAVAGEAPQFYLLLPDGKQQISQGAAAVLHAARSGSTTVPVATNAISEAPATKKPLEQLDSFPERTPKPLTWAQAQSSCLNWTNAAGGPQIQATVSGSDQTAPKAPVKLAQFDGPGPQVDEFYMPAGKAAVTHSAQNTSGAESGPLGMVSDQGVFYGIKDANTAKGLGLIRGDGDAKPAPSWLTRVLPRGAFLDPGEASYAYDSIPVPPNQGVNRPLPKKQ